MDLLEIYLSFQQWKNFENALRIDIVIAMSFFFSNTVQGSLEHCRTGVHRKAMYTTTCITRGQSNLTKSASRPRMHRLATVHARDNQPTNDVTTQPISISASFTKVKWGALKVNKRKKERTEQLQVRIIMLNLSSMNSLLWYGVLLFWGHSVFISVNYLSQH